MNPAILHDRRIPGHVRAVFVKSYSSDKPNLTLRVIRNSKMPNQDVSRDVIVIGSGFSGLSAACCLARDGFVVTVLEKNTTPGGRARMFEADGFRFDMGPSWYWMPDVFEQFFQRFGKTVSDYYQLTRLDPSYRIYFGREDIMDLPAGLDPLYSLFETYEPGSSVQLKKFLSDAEFKYKTGMQEFVFKPAHSPMEFVNWKIMKAGLRLQLLKSLSAEIKGRFKDSRLVRLLEFPVLFLGATPNKTPAMYSMMNYADMALGTWYPDGGMVRIVDAMVSLAKELGVRFVFESEVKKILVTDRKASGVVTTSGMTYPADVVVGGADYHHLEQHVLDPPFRQYSPAYWESRVMAPSSLIFYLGLNKKLRDVRHHNLFFDADFTKHSEEIYTSKKWPTDPLFYMSVPSVTDSSVAPPGHENLFVLMPIAPGLDDGPELRDHYDDLMIRRIENITGQSVRDHIIYKRSYGSNDFISDYHSFKGNAYGLANTLRQTAFLKPRMKSRKLENLFYTGQLTVPGPGIPPALISGQIVAKEVLNLYA